MKAEPVIISVQHDAPPPEYDGTARILGRTAEVVAKAATLKPGDWFVWPKPPANWKKRLDLFKGLPVKVYRTADKRVVVRHQEAATVAGPARTEPIAAQRPAAVGTPGDPKQRAVLRKLAAVGRAMPMGDLAHAVGPVGCADAVAALRAKGLLLTDVVGGKDRHQLSAAGRDAAAACAGDDA